MDTFTTFLIQQREILLILGFYIAAWLFHRFARRIATYFMSLNRLARKNRQMSPTRRQTLQSLLANAISILAFVTATILSLSLYIEAATLLWIVGLFSAAFGLGARPLVSDFLGGVNFIFENTFEVGEKIEISGLAGGKIVEGLVEEVNLRITLVRANTGELYTIPNGEIRVIRNFSRGLFSTANVKLQVKAADLHLALDVLDLLANEAVQLLPNLLEPWQIISETGEIGERTELTLVTKTKFGNSAEMKPRLLSLVQDRLAKANIPLDG